MRVHVCAARACVRNFDTITCTCRCERAVIFAWRDLASLRSLRFGCMCVREFHAPSGCICDRAARALRVHVSAPCGCVISFFEAHSPLRSAARETTLRVGSASLPKNKMYRFASLRSFGNVACHDRSVASNMRFICVTAK